MAVLRMRFGWLPAVLTVLMLAGTSAQGQPVTNTFHVEVYDEQSVQGFCDGDYPRWYYYENTGWWNQWFYNGPYDPDRKKVINVTLTITPIQPRAGSIVRLAYNWSTPAWKPGSGPPLPPLTSAEEEEFIGRQTFFQANFIPEDGWQIEREYEISDYNPEWVSIDVQGYNFIIDGVIIHECVEKEEPTQACCFDDGHCEDLTDDECKRKGGDPQGPNTNCATVNCPQPQEACCLPDGTCVYTTTENCRNRGGTPQGAGTTCADVICPKPPQACCFPDGSCQNLSPEVCVENGGSPQGPGTACLGDTDKDGIDDICERGPCEICGPGPHWVDQCAGGQDSMTDHGATVLVDLDLDCEPDVGLVLVPCALPENLLVVNRSNPMDDSLNYPGTRPLDGHLDVIDTEIVEMCLTNGVVTLRAGLGKGQGGVLPPSLGVVAEQPGDPTVAESFFDVFFEIDLGGGMYAYNHIPLRVEADITCIPPQASYMHPTDCIPLYSSPKPGEGAHIANLTRGEHAVYPDEFPRPEACCLPDGTCINTTVDECLGKGGDPQGPWTTCANIICPQPQEQEACCFADGHCEDLTPEECKRKGGTPQGANTNCANIVCPQPPQACCLPDGTCVDETPDDCLAKGGTPQGPGTDCTMVDCPEPGECDWNPGDPHKMHFPQLPDPGGWDVDVTADNVLADDWKCSKTGPVTDIHFWYSWLSDDVGIIDSIHVSIHADDRSGTYSKPGALLWERDFGPDQFNLRFYGTGQQGFMIPGPDPQFRPNDHVRIYQCNICNIPDPYTQQEGRIYWLDISIKVRDPLVTQIGWKTSLEHFEDDGVYDASPLAGWAPLYDPITGETLDLAFVITGEEEPPPTIEIDPFPSAVGEIELETAMGQVEAVALTGPVEMHVYFLSELGKASDPDGDGLDQVETELVEMTLTGESMMLGRVQVRLNPDLPSLGEIEERENMTPGTLDLKPFVDGDFPADSFFDVFVEVEIDGMMMNGMMMMTEATTSVVLYPQEPLQLHAVITHKPPRPCESYESLERVELYDAFGNPTGIYVTRLVVHPNPCEEPPQACCLPDGTCVDTTPNDCIAMGGTPQGANTNCANIVCPQPPQACCLPDGTCIDTTPTDCIAKGGTPQGAGTDCSTVNCPVCDWNPGDPHKMHWPQLPDLDPTGLDVEWERAGGHSLADDFLCSAAGPITDIHIWCSFYDDILPEDGPGSLSFYVAIRANRPAGDVVMFSMPQGTPLWSRVFNPGQYTVRLFHEGPQGWYDPGSLGVDYEPDNHKQTYQYNFCIDEDPFVQEEGTIYWLEVRARPVGPTGSDIRVGWKTTQRDLRWMDDAVEGHNLGGITAYSRLTYPYGHEYEQETLDLAFVITGEPGPPPQRQACCLPDGTCENLTPARCAERGGTLQGPGTDCATVICPGPDECDWNLDDPYKMHFPQLPDRTGWDVDVTADNVLADDWKCTETGPVTDIHFWYSWLNDDVGIIDNVHVSIHADDRSGPYSKPGVLLWERDFGPDQFSLRYYGKGIQGFMMPGPSPQIMTNDHRRIYQCNICNIPDPYTQQEGIIYWLDISVKIRDPLNTHIGWKTSWEQFEDDAVYYAGPDVGWVELIDPLTGVSLDLAFVITGGVAPVVQACCFDDGTCQNLLPHQCVSLGGVPQGPGTQCSAPRACCLPDGSCVMVDPLCCDDMGGKVMPTGTACSATPEACCLPDGSCIMADPLCCADMGGTPQGPGTQCSAARQPCCLPDGSCKMLDPLCCDDLGGKPSPIGAAACLGDADGDGIDDACQGLPSDEVDCGDAPEASVAYPSLCVQGSFPTCVGIGPAGWIQHTNSRAYFGQKVDFENEGNAGMCPVFTPNTYDQDECFQDADGDGGLMTPPAYTIQGAIGLETVVPCVDTQTGSLGQVCQTAVWGVDIDIHVVNNNADARRFVNVLADWNRDGKWGGSMTCASGLVANEHVLVNFAVPAGYNGPLSGLNPPSFTIGPYPGYVWFRFMISESLILTTTPDGSVYDWDGSGSFRDGETEDYLLHVLGLLKPYDCHWDEDEGHKMHWPQLPDLKPTGVDVDNFWVPLADDFLCTQSGPIRDIHIWGSFAGDCLPPAGVGGMTFKLTIYTNVPADADSTMPWSRPGEPKWTRVFEPCQYTVRRIDEEGPEDWYDPATGLYVPGDHFQVYQYNFCINEEPFMIQEEGAIYWLEVKDITPDDAGATFGWKTTIVEPDDLRYMDDAVWRNEDPAMGPVGWLPLKYPKGHDYFNQTMDLAFVITGEKEPCYWKPGDPHKMHFPQLPDPQGWDVDVVADNISADDWKCTASGTVDDIHFWYSWLGDKVGIIDNIHASIHSNVAADDPTNPYDYSVPGELLWERDFGPDEFSLCYWGSGNQGFIMPGGQGKPNDHKMIFQCDIINIPDPFPQEKGKIYWLDLSIKVRDPVGTHIGWKTSQDHFEDDAVYDAGPAGWQEWIDPITGDSLDLAFVITGKEEVAAHELGDAPDSSNSFLLTPMTAYPKGGPAGVQANYPVVFGAGSPPHGPIHLQPKAAVWLGPAVTLENEADIGPDEDAVNNIDPPNDQPDQDRADDGVQVPLVLPHCKQTTFDYGVQIVPGAPNLDWYVNVWFDWNRDGDWDDAPQCPSTAAVIVADEWAVQNQLIPLPPGYHVITTPLFRCWHPTGDDDPGPIWMRITLSERKWDPGPAVGTTGYGGCGPANGYLYGETEDYYFVPGMPERDWGDAPDGDLVPGYPTLATNIGANHIIGGPWLGNAGDVPDPEPDGQPDLNALGDDLDTGAGNPGPNHDDEDGALIPPLIRGQTVNAAIQVNGGGGIVQVWVDFDGSKSWEPAEQVFNAFRGNGFHAIPIPVPNNAVLGQTFARFRISVNGGLPPGGPAPDGEVEDHEVWINDPPPNTKWLNLPDLTPWGIDIRADDLRILADDFECTSYSRVTDVHLWCSWKDDIKGEIKNIHLSIHADDPAGPEGDETGNNYSQPSRDPLWTGDFGPGEFTEELYYVVRYPKEYWWDPANNELNRHGDSEVWLIEIYINPDEAFLQKGSPDNPIIYWLDVRFETENGQIGWKTRQWPHHFMDDAVWDRGSELPRIWKELRYPKGHPYHGLERDSIDMAFVITSEEEGLPPKPAIKNVKWSQPPIEIDPRSRTPLYCGWDELSFATTQPNIANPVHWSIAADDFRCLGSMPITSVHWWGSYRNANEGWQEPNPPAIKPSSWRIGFWSNVVWSSIPPNTEPDYSHPGKLLWQISVPADKVHEERVGVDRFPNRPSDTCFQYYVELEPKQYFWQEKYVPNTQDNVFWISIVAVYDHPTGNIPFTWGWKTRPWHWMDDAVRFMYGDPVEVGLELPAAAFTPIEGELECAGAVIKRSFDMAFELDTDPSYIKWEQGYTGIRDWRHYADEESLAFERTVTETVTKYRQEPDLSEKGVDVDATLSLAKPQTLADDFECTTTGPLTDIHIWGSWYNDEPPGGDPCNVIFRLSIHKDIPANSDTIPGYSMPGEQLWEGVFQPGQFTVERVSTNVPEGYYNACGPLPVVPPTNYIPQNHFKVFKYNFYIDADEAFPQEGTPDKPIVYWLDVQAQPILIGGITDARFGWKTSLEHWNDDAVWRTNIMPISRPWEELRYPDGHPYHPNSIDLAFEITTETEEKELRVRRLVADDWLCKRETPVTAAVWWGSYIGYSYRPCACPVMAPPVKPDYFLLSIWSDVRPTDEVPYSHPGEKIWHYKADDYDEVLVGYDKHPHGAPNEPVFRYSVRLPEDKWFCQDGVDQIYWFSVVAVYKEGTDPLYPWGWTNHRCHECKAWEPPGLAEVTHFKFDETGGITASDSSGNGNHGTLVGDPTWKPCCGAVCGALDFDGDGDYVKTAEATTGLDFAPNSFSVSVWINAREVADGWKTVLEYDRDGWDDNRFGVWLSSEGRFHFRVGFDTKNSDQTLDPDKWYLLTGTYNATDKKMSLYIDGNFDSSRILTKGFNSPKAAKLTIGVRGSEDAEYFNGLIDDLRIYDYVLSEEDIKGLAGMKRNDDAVAGHVDTSGAAPVWSWKELYDQTDMSEDMSFILFTDCFPCTYSTYPDWLALGKPRCWCAPPAGSGYQCDGDADGGTETFFKYRILGKDLNLVVGNWQRKAGDPLLDPCADIDHKSEGFFKYRVFGKDLTTVVTNWKKKDRGEPYDPTTQLPGDCPRPE